MYITSQVKSRDQSQAKMFQNVRRTCRNKYVDELEQKLNDRFLPPVPVPSSQRWAQITLYQKRYATKRNDLFNQ